MAIRETSTLAGEGLSTQAETLSHVQRNYIYPFVVVCSIYPTSRGTSRSMGRD